MGWRDLSHRGIPHTFPVFEEESVIEARALIQLMTDAALEKKALNPVVLNVEGMATYTDFFLICSGSSTRQVQAIADAIEKRAREAKVHPLTVEGQTSGKWILMDYGSVVVHLFYEPVRDFYDLEGLWADAKRMPIPSDRPEAVSAS